MSELKHKWVNQPSQDWPGVATIDIWNCSVCGCQKNLGRYRFAEPQYSRSGQVYSRYVECVDMAYENTKTID